MKILSYLWLAMSLATGPAMAQDAPLKDGEKQQLVERAGDFLVKNYIFPDRAAQAKEKISNALASGSYDDISDPSAFAKRLTADLQSVTHDKHMRVTLTPINSPPPASSEPAPPSNYAGFARVDRLKGNIGYIKLLGFPAPGPFNAVADQAMTDLATTDALIIDMRDNGGGSPETVAYLCSFFFDPGTPVHINDLIYRKPGTSEFVTTQFWTRPISTPYLGKPVFVLTSSRTFSGGEEFVNDLKVQKRATVIGETTGGGANPGGGNPLNLRFGIFIPTGRAENPVTKTNWEGTGVTPDVSMDAKLAFQAAALDIIAQRKNGRAELGAMKSQLADQTDVDPFVEAHLLKFRTTALPNSASAVRRNIEDLARGMPNYDLMSKDLAGATKAQLPQLQGDLSKLGAVKTVTFRYIGPAGLDVYDVTMANGSVQSGIFVSPDGKILSAWIRPAPVTSPAAQ